jgi:DNA processing protein
VSRSDRIGLAFLGLHPDRTRSLVERHGSAKSVLRLAAGGRLDGIGPDRVVATDARVMTMERAGCRPVLLGDPEYPAALAELGDPPDVLFVRGSLPMSPGVAVVGTRRCTGYGTRLATAFGRAIAAAGWPLVSGLARGIDGAAHRGTVDGGGVGVAVLGSGSDIIYPQDHRELHHGLLDSGGAVITEYPPGTRPDGWRFPPRNRIISGLSAAVVVVEAGVTGGALVTAMRAGEQGRVLFAVPGDVDREASVGCNLLIRDGAVPVLGPDDLVEGLSLVLGPPSRAPVSTPEPHALGGVDGAVLAAVRSPIAPDDLAAVLGLPVPRVLAAVARLELNGSVVARDGLVVAVGPR